MPWFILLGDKWGYIGFEPPTTNAKHDDADRKAGDGAVRMGNDWGKCGHNEDDVADNGDEYGNLDSLEAAPVLVGHVGS